MMLEILVSHLERVCGLQAILSDNATIDIEGIRERGGLAKALEDTNLEEIVQLLKLLQEVMRISSAANRAMVQHQLSLSQVGG